MRKSAFFAALVILIGTGVIHGLWTDRWVISAEPEASLRNSPVSARAQEMLVSRRPKSEC